MRAAHPVSLLDRRTKHDRQRDPEDKNNAPVVPLILSSRMSRREPRTAQQLVRADCEGSVSYGLHLFHDCPQPLHESAPCGCSALETVNLIHKKSYVSHATKRRCLKRFCMLASSRLSRELK